MTPDMLDDASLGSALAALWQRHRQSNLDRISLLEATTADILRAVADDEAIAESARAAHQLAGSLGTFGFDVGSRSALEAEYLLRQPVIDAQLLAEAVTTLRYAVEDVGHLSTTGPDQSVSDGAAANLRPDAMIDSKDADLVSRLDAEAASFGITVVPFGDRSLSDTGDNAVVTPVFIDDTSAGPLMETDLVSRVTRRAEGAFVIVLTDRDTFEERLELAAAGADTVIRRSQSARQMILALLEILAQQRLPQTTVLVSGVSTDSFQSISQALDTSNCRIERHDDPLGLWQALEDHGADLVIVGTEGSGSGGLDLCRVIRSHPRWRQLPLCVAGTPTSESRHEAVMAGADDYLEAWLSHESVRARLLARLERGRAVRARNDVDPLTGTENRQSAERSLEHLLGLAHQRERALALVQVGIDRFEEIRNVHGNAMADVVLRGLGARLLEEFGDGDVVGRWTSDGFVLGVSGVTSDVACESVTKVLRSFSADSFSTTSGKSARFSFNAGIASSPADGSTLASLERVSETALRRAAAGQIAVVVAGERPPAGSANMVDVVLVEDDDSVADVIEYALGLHHYGFLRFNDGAEAARALGQGEVKAGVVLLDVGLPSLDGFGVLQVMNKQGVLDGTRVIMLTARSSEAEMLRALGLGAMEHIAKPFSIPVLLGRLDQTRSRAVA
jgi:diguanylate cyclase (GGDEF)-like protein